MDDTVSLPGRAFPICAQNQNNDALDHLQVSQQHDNNNNKTTT
jgi:hypothetical protein